MNINYMSRFICSRTCETIRILSNYPSTLANILFAISSLHHVRTGQKLCLLKSTGTYFQRKISGRRRKGYRFGVFILEFGVEEENVAQTELENVCEKLEIYIEIWKYEVEI